MVKALRSRLMALDLARIHTMSKGTQQGLRDWFLAHRRSLPWRQAPTPYCVWISEIMLQQTRAEVVIPYFFRWFELFPDIESLARAPIEKVIKAWEGLGYYSRARSIHKTAQILVEYCEKELPKGEKELLKLKGIGPYTAAAIAAFAFGKKAAPLDGNAMRVLARWSAFDQKLTTAKAQKALREQFNFILPDDRPYEVAEGIIELGALICKPKNPSCSLCPLKSSCRAHQRDQIDRYPVKDQRIKSHQLVRLALLIEKKGDAVARFIVRKNLADKVMRDLWEFPHFELYGQDADCLITQHLQLVYRPLIPPPWNCFDDHQFAEWTPLVRHTFTRYRVYLRGLRVHSTQKRPDALYSDEQWDVRSFSIPELLELPFSAGHRRLLVHLTEQRLKT